MTSDVLVPVLAPLFSVTQTRHLAVGIAGDASALWSVFTLIEGKEFNPAKF